MLVRKNLDTSKIIRHLKNLTGDLLRMDTGEELQEKSAEIRMDKYQQRVFLFVFKNMFKKNFI